MFAERDKGLSLRVPPSAINWIMEIRELTKDEKLITCTRSELKKLKASDLNHGDIVHVGKYFIYIRYRNWEGTTEYDIPALLSYVETESGKTLDCTPGSSSGFTPYYIDEFKSR